MANYECASRTSYFKTTDEVKLRELIDLINSEHGDIELHQNSNGLFCMADYGDITVYYDDEGDQVEIFDKIGELIPAGEVVVFYEVGHTKLFDLTGIAIAVCKREDGTVVIEMVDLHDAIQAKVMNIMGEEYAMRGY